jgi:hypothetical protein
MRPLRSAVATLAGGAKPSASTLIAALLIGRRRAAPAKLRAEYA